MSKTIWIILGIIVIIGLVSGALIWFNDDETSEESNSQTVSTEQSTQTTETAEEVEMINKETVQLISVRQTNESGAAERYTGNDGKYTLVATANLDELPEDKFYEGWVVGDGRVISTGKLNQEANGVFSLIYTSEEDLFAQNRVVITEETLSQGLDNKPEDHVIEGSF